MKCKKSSVYLTICFVGLWGFAHFKVIQAQFSSSSSCESSSDQTCTNMDKSKQIAKCEGAYNKCFESYKALMESFNVLEGNIKSCKKDVKEADKNLCSCEKMKQDCSGNLNTCEANLKKCQEKLEGCNDEECEEQLQQCMTQYNECKGILEKCLCNMQHCTEDLDQCNEHVTACAESVSKLEDEVRECDTEKEDCQDELQDCTEGIECCTTELTDCNNNITICEEGFNSCNESLQECVTLNDTCQANTTCCLQDLQKVIDYCDSLVTPLEKCKLCRYNNHLYYISSDAVLWEAAVAACNAMGGGLVTVATKDEYKNIAQMIDTCKGDVTQQYYLCDEDSTTQDVFKCRGKNAPPSINGILNPKVSGSHCLSLDPSLPFTGLLTYQDCSAQTLNYICQIDAPCDKLITVS